jgi:4a-hydroxytetrahydrobiopterin dehydratase
MISDKQVLTPRMVEPLGLTDWRVMTSALHARFATGTFATGLQLVDRLGVVAEEMDHHPDVDLSYPVVDVRITSHDVGGITQRDVRLAQRISEIAADLGVTARPAELQVLELALDTSDHERIKPFWKAVLGYVDGPSPDELAYPGGRVPLLWFQASLPHEEPRQRWHLDIRVPPEQVQPRIDAALAAGGTLVSEHGVPSFWVLADPDGNRACLTTWRGRDDDA